MEDLIAQIRAAMQNGAYYLALFGTLALIDICGALDTPDGRSSGPRFKAWLRANVPELAGNADQIWTLRCSLLHQGSALPHGGNHPPIAFTLPGHGTLMNLTIDTGTVSTTFYTLTEFINEVARSTEDWLARVGETDRVQQNLARFARLRLEGLPPLLAGTPVIG